MTDIGKSMCFVIGSPRSGTTILADILGYHPEIARIHEPYFLWDWRTGSGVDDIRTEAQVSPEIRRFLRAEFQIFLAKSGKRLLVEKTPENAFRVPYMNAVFPGAKWIHIYRDGRDVVSSIEKERQQRKDMVENLNVRALASVAGRTLRRQPYWRNRLQLLHHEMLQNFSINPRRLFNKKKWKGKPLWGPRFPGWEETYQSLPSPTVFSALQWLHSVQAAREGLANIAEANKMEVRYEDLVSRRADIMKDIFCFLGVSDDAPITEELRATSIGKWKLSLSEDDVGKVMPHIGDLLRELGYC